MNENYFEGRFMKAIIFDLWLTLGTKNTTTANTLKEHFNIKSEKYMREYEESIQLEDWSSDDEMARSFLSRFNIEQNEENIEFVKDLINEGIEKSAPYDWVPKLLEELHKNYKIGLLSNTTKSESSVIKKWGIDRFIDAQLFSWQLGELKPSTESFLAICKKLDVHPTEALFIDDSEKNTSAARIIGIDSITFIDIDQLKKEMKDRKIKIRG